MNENSNDHKIFLTILENSDEEFNKIIKISKITNYEDGPYIKLHMSNILKNKMEKSIKASKFYYGKLNIYSYISESFDKFLDYINDMFYNHSEHINTFSNNQTIDIYMNNKAGFAIELNYYLIVNKDIIDNVILRNKENNNEIIKETNNEIIKETNKEIINDGYVYSTLRYLNLV